MISILGIVGSVTDPWALISPNSYPTTGGQGLLVLFNNLLRTVIALGGVYALINIVVAGYQFMSSEGNPEKITVAWAKIWQTLVGLLIVAGSLALAALFGYLIYQDPTAIISPRIFGPT